MWVSFALDGVGIRRADRVGGGLAGHRSRLLHQAFALALHLGPGAIATCAICCRSPNGNFRKIVTSPASISSTL